MKPVTVTETIQKPPDHKFGKSVLRPHSGHCRASLLWSQVVHRNEPSAVPSRNSRFAMTMFFIVVDIAERNEIIHRVLALIFVMPYMMQLKHLSRIVRRRF